MEQGYSAIKATCAKELAARDEELNAFRNLGRTWARERNDAEEELEALRKKLADRDALAKTARASLVAETVKRQRLESEIARLKTRPQSPPEIAPARFQKSEDAAQTENARVFRDVRTVLKNFPDARFHLIGHTSSESTASLNLELSIRRAKNLAAYLVAHGLPMGRVTYEGRGEFSPLADNNTEEGRALNRRVEIWVTD